MKKKDQNKRLCIIHDGELSLEDKTCRSIPVPQVLLKGEVMEFETYVCNNCLPMAKKLGKDELWELIWKKCNENDMYYTKTKIVLSAKQVREAEEKKRQSMAGKRILSKYRLVSAYFVPNSGMSETSFYSPILNLEWNVDD